MRGPPPRVLLACDKFKGSLTAARANAAVAAGITRRIPDATLVPVPVADGGEGTVAAALAAGFRAHPLTVSGPTGEPVRSVFAVRADTAVLELATLCGSCRLPGGRPRPLTASSRGLGEAFGQALDLGVQRVVLGVGGSASTDAGTGMLAALGAGFLDAAGDPVPDGGGQLHRITRVELGTLDPRVRDCQVVLAADVTNPLLGASGAAAVFAPQKGADTAQVELLETGLRHVSALIGQATGADLTAVPGAGAAGGVGFAALAVLGARRRPGVEVVLDLSGFAAAARGADLVVTGEGSLDEQTLSGKAPLGVARAAADAGVPVVAVAGQCSLDADQVTLAGLAGVYPLTGLEPDLRVCRRDAARLLEQVGEQIAVDLLAPG